MNDKKWIYTGIIIFTGIMLIPLLWGVAGGKKEVPNIELSDKAKKAGYCVMANEEMKAGHMQILDIWRDTVVRKAERVYTKVENFQLLIRKKNYEYVITP